MESGHQVNYFNPLTIHLEPAAATDCTYMINQIIPDNSNRTCETTFGTTDAADIDLAKAENRKQQHGRCEISPQNDDYRQKDALRLLD